MLLTKAAFIRWITFFLKKKKEHPPAPKRLTSNVH